VRAALIGLALVIGLVDGCPLPPEPYVRPWQRGIVDVVRPMQRQALVPFRWVTRTLRFSQRWALMQAADRERYRFTVEGRTASGEWQVLFRANDADHAAFAEVLENHHVLGTWNPTDRMTSQYNAFVGWLTAYALAQRPDLAAVRTSQEKVLIEDGELRGTGERTAVMTRERDRGRR
jgi:hypothetical protein